MRSKRIVVTGGAGFLGSHVVKKLLNESHDVVILDDFSNGKLAHLNGFLDHPRLTVIKGDIVDEDVVGRAFAGRQVAIHLAVLDLRQSIRDPRRVSTVIVDGTLNCLNAARKNGVELFLNCSSSEVYGTADYVPMDEAHPLRPETPYAAAKVAQDKYTSSFGRTYGLPWATIRPFNMYGPHSHWQGTRGELIPKMIVRAMNARPLVLFGDGAQTRDFLYVEEAASAVVAMVDNPACLRREFNLCTGKETSVRRIAELICQFFCLDPMNYIELQSPRPGDVMRHMGDGEIFRGASGFVPEVGIEEGIKRTIAWLKSLPYTPQQLLAGEVLRNWE